MDRYRQGCPNIIHERREVLAGFGTRTLSVAGAGTPLVLLHGFSDSADTWRPVLTRLAARGRSAVAVDLPSHAHADPIDLNRPVLGQLTAFVEALVRGHDPDGRAVVVGNSLGGMLGLLIAECLGSLGGVVAVSPAGPGYAPWMLACGAQLRGPLRRRVLTEALGVPPAWVAGWAARRVISGALWARADVDPRFIERYGRHLASRTARRRTITLLCRLVDEALTSPVHPGRIRCPLLLIWGERDPLTPSSAALTVLDAVPVVRYELLERVGHLPQQEAPDRFVELLDGFPPDLTSSAGSQQPGGR